MFLIDFAEQQHFEVEDGFLVRLPGPAFTYSNSRIRIRTRSPDICSHVLPRSIFSIDDFEVAAMPEGGMNTVAFAVVVNREMCRAGLQGLIRNTRISMLGDISCRRPACAVAYDLQSVVIREEIVRWDELK